MVDDEITPQVFDACLYAALIPESIQLGLSPISHLQMDQKLGVTSKQICRPSQSQNEW